jgi:hypothetical protein
VHFFTKFWKFKKTAFFRYVKRLGMTTVGMPGHGFTFPVGGIVPVIFSSMVCLNIHNPSTRSHQSEEEISLQIAPKIASVNGPL